MYFSCEISQNEKRKVQHLIWWMSSVYIDGVSYQHPSPLHVLGKVLVTTLACELLEVFLLVSRISHLQFLEFYGLTVNKYYSK